MRTNLSAALALTLLAGWVPGQVAARCLSYGSNSLSGTIVQQTHAGGPDYRSVTSGDKPIIVWVLLLDEFICVVDAASRLPGEYGEREVQLVLEEAQYAQYWNFLGKKVTVTGTLRHGHADYKRLLIVPREIVLTDQVGTGKAR